MKLEFGCGETPRRPDFFGVDIRPLPNIKFVCNAWDIDQHVEDSSVDEIYSRHFLEHLTFHQAAKTLTVWHKILKPNGIITTIVPDMDFHIKQWTNKDRKALLNNISYEDRACFGFWGKQRQEDLNNFWDVHKSGYDFPLLRDKLEQLGFTKVKRIKDKPKNLHVTCIK